MTEEKRKVRNGGSGNALITFRLEPEAYARLLEEVPADQHEVRGRAGGVSLLMRKLVYEHLGMSLPVQHGDLGRSSKKRRRKPEGG